MIPAPFDYAAPATLDEAIDHLARGGDAKVLSGGQSLLPLLKLRLGTVGTLVDLRRVPGLSYIREEGGRLRIGGATRECELERSELQLFEWVAQRQLRAYGYPIGGELGRPPASALAGYYRLRAFREARHVARVARDAVAARREPPVATLFGSGTRTGPAS